MVSLARFWATCRTAALITAFTLTACHSAAMSPIPALPYQAGNALQLPPYRATQLSSGEGFKLLHEFQKGHHECNPSCFGDGDGIIPLAAPVTGKNGELVGSTYLGGSANWGAIYKLTPSGKDYVERVIYSFKNGSDGAGPEGRLVVDRTTGVIYGIAAYDGGAGTIFKLTPSGANYTMSVLHNFGQEDDGAGPVGGLIADGNGALYGTTFTGGRGCGTQQHCRGCGTVFRLKHSGSSYTESVIYAFRCGMDGNSPQGSLVFDARGALYGTTMLGGLRGCRYKQRCGLVFKLTPSGSSYKESVLYRFKGGRDGWSPRGTLLIGAHGVLYGTTPYGGPYDSGNCIGYHCGTVFELTPSPHGYRESIIYAFKGGNDGVEPNNDLVADSGGTLYGTTAFGGAVNLGTIFKLTPAKSGYAERLVYAFTGYSDGNTPFAGLSKGQNGELFGTASQGGIYVYGGSRSTTCGTVFKLTP